MTNRVAADQLRAFVERVERLNAEAKDIAEMRKEVMAEAKGAGYDTAVLAAIVKMRAADPDKRSEFEAVMDMYREALGL